MIWIIVCDGSSAKIFQKDHRFSSLQYLESFTHTHESTREHGKDRPGKNFESSSAAHHAYEPKTDWHEAQKEVFIKQISLHTLKAFQDHRFSEIYFISPAKLSKIFRDFFELQIDTQQRNKLSIHRIHKDLTHSTTDEIDALILKGEK